MTADLWPRHERIEAAADGIARAIDLARADGMTGTVWVRIDQRMQGGYVRETKWYIAPHEPATNPERWVPYSLGEP